MKHVPAVHVDLDVKLRLVFPVLEREVPRELTAFEPADGESHGGPVGVELCLLEAHVEDVVKQ